MQPYDCDPLRKSSRNTEAALQQSERYPNILISTRCMSRAEPMPKEEVSPEGRCTRDEGLRLSEQHGIWSSAHYIIFPFYRLVLFFSLGATSCQFSGIPKGPPFLIYCRIVILRGGICFVIAIWHVGKGQPLDDLSRSQALKYIDSGEDDYIT
jgi:hypothetical protein